MTRDELMKKIEGLLPLSTISDYHKMMTKAFLPSLDDAKLDNIYKSLVVETDKLSRIAEAKKRIVMKYKVMVENLAKATSQK